MVSWALPPMNMPAPPLPNAEVPQDVGADEAVEDLVL